MAVAFVFIDRLTTFVLEPTRRMLPPGARLIYTHPGEAFSLYVYVALIAGALLASPLVMFQVWRFIAPGLYANEKRLVVPFVALTTAGAVGGAAFSHYVLYPSMISFFGTFNSPELAFMPRVEDAFDLYLKMMFGMVLVFQMPTLVFFLARMRMVTASLPVAQHQVHGAHHLHRCRGAHAFVRPVEPGGVCRAHARPLRAVHWPGVGGRAASTEGRGAVEVSGLPSSAWCQRFGVAGGAKFTDTVIRTGTGCPLTTVGVKCQLRTACRATSSSSGTDRRTRASVTAPVPSMTISVSTAPLMPAASASAGYFGTSARDGGGSESPTR